MISIESLLPNLWLRWAANGEVAIRHGKVLQPRWASYQKIGGPKAAENIARQ